MYENLFTPPLKSNAKLIEGNAGGHSGQASQISSPISGIYPSTSDFGTSINNINVGVTSELSNEYLLNQKLRNTGLYSKLKNKTMYSKSAYEHASLNMGIL